jgi:hypothetical protein
MIIAELYMPSRKALPVFSPYGYLTATMMTHFLLPDELSMDKGDSIMGSIQLEGYRWLEIHPTRRLARHLS